MFYVYGYVFIRMSNMGLYVSLCVCECVAHLYIFCKNYISGRFRRCFIFVIFLDMQDFQGLVHRAVCMILQFLYCIGIHYSIISKL
jgi:hypothetical protein